MLAESYALVHRMPEARKEWQIVASGGDPWLAGQARQHLAKDKWYRAGRYRLRTRPPIITGTGHWVQ
ncbi:MAG: hypothetical protein ACLQVD_03830 [Capsulimonadaceae bacterium]